MTAPVSSRVRGRDGVEVAVHRWGAPGERPVVVLQHGFAADSIRNWQASGVVAALLADGREVVAVDARGHGASDKPHEPERYGERAMATDLAEVADALDLDRFDLAGYSMGGIVSLVLAGTDQRVRRLVVGGIGAGVVERGGLDTRAVRSTALVSALETDDPASIPDPTAAAFRAFADSTGADRLALAAHVRAINTEPLPLADIAAPTLVVAGDADPLAVRPQVLADAISGARLVTVPGDHLGAVRTPEFVAALVGFLGDDGGS
ncbi:Pimeloyl-ACP methyl ester carboxylesterase [Blastococcus aurantiacus]|uniref:Pimeloyl-ACP methyl ester carboxylesterase n=1 Tax=Blastococcus aurantiacus TaxID=1550231 RepID=A0A1G7KTF8_9ACTN|nr:alpha/beta hydrolase [Blastococcus aurantiacus]SDF40503.1 Pimeloyl-ACP methyl ester carboxylesterase [Blastococcus aurantiacus]